eukprot:TRINITY_DN260_c2_g1_i1.p1 TRINITY_DN260_c2_g1~~TRINITY_DN260_c2_g1_i1.p1  ORF type:complete len:164 (-),score=22.52 TRINITY_DN260_c2_g1_i1:1293-1784(-)
MMWKNCVNCECLPIFRLHQDVATYRLLGNSNNNRSDNNKTAQEEQDSANPAGGGIVETPVSKGIAMISEDLQKKRVVEIPEDLKKKRVGTWDHGNYGGKVGISLQLNEDLTYRCWWLESCEGGSSMTACYQEVKDGTWNLQQYPEKLVLTPDPIPGKNWLRKN